MESVIMGPLVTFVSYTQIALFVWRGILDRVSRERRSYIMSRVPTRDSTIELRVRKDTYIPLGIRFRVHRRDLPGRPDVVLPRFRTALVCAWVLLARSRL